MTTRSWHLALEDPGSGDWREHWVLDGQRASVRNTDRGMVFEAGPVARDDACHAVLWTKKRFAGDLKVCFEFTRLDTVNRYVNILYLQANGTGEGPYAEDIHQWAHLREIPSMATYFRHMNLLHVSYAAFGNDTDDPEDYIRVRRYPVREDRTFDQMEVGDTVFNTGLFKPGITYEMTFIKTRDELTLTATGGGCELCHSWDLSTVEPTCEGPLGIRHMVQKCSRYRNIRIYTA